MTIYGSSTGEMTNACCRDIKFFARNSTNPIFMKIQQQALLQQPLKFRPQASSS